MYIWRRGPRRLESLQPWATAAEETPTVGSTDRWGKASGVVAHGAKIASAVSHGGRALTSWPTAAGAAYIRGQAPTADPSLHPPNLRRSTSSERF
jgi:hypothetical protein